jgi:hypothetical protein
MWVNELKIFTASHKKNTIATDLDTVASFCMQINIIVKIKSKIQNSSRN